GAIAQAAEAAYNRHGVRAGQQFILRCLWHTDGQTPGQVAKRLDLATPTVTRAATRMEAAGLLHRAPHPSDARLVRLCLTAKGRRRRGRWPGGTAGRPAAPRPARAATGGRPRTPPSPPTPATPP